MSHALHLHPRDQQHLYALHSTFKKNANRIGLSTAAASFLILGALIVIVGACLCLTLPGVNVISNVILPGVLPGSCTLLLSIPFIVFSVLKSREKNTQRKKVIDWNICLLQFYNAPQMEEREAVQFIKNNFFEPDWAKEYSSKVIGDIKERFPKEKGQQSTEDQALLKALDEARTEIFKKK